MGEQRRKCQTFYSPPRQNQSRKSVFLLLPLLLWEFLHLDVGLLMLVRDVTQWLEHMSSSEECSNRQWDGAGCLNQQWSFHLRLMLPFIMPKPLKCTSRQFFIQQGWGLRTEVLRNTVPGWEKKTIIIKCCWSLFEFWTAVVMRIILNDWGNVQNGQSKWC